MHFGRNIDQFQQNGQPTEVSITSESLQQNQPFINDFQWKDNTMFNKKSIDSNILHQLFSEILHYAKISVYQFLKALKKSEGNLKKQRILLLRQIEQEIKHAITKSLQLNVSLRKIVKLQIQPIILIQRVTIGLTNYQKQLILPIIYDIISKITSNECSLLEQKQEILQFTVRNYEQNCLELLVKESYFYQDLKMKYKDIQLFYGKMQLILSFLQHGFYNIPDNNLIIKGKNINKILFNN